MFGIVTDVPAINGRVALPTARPCFRKVAINNQSSFPMAIALARAPLRRQSKDATRIRRAVIDLTPDFLGCHTVLRNKEGTKAREHFIT